MGINPPLHKVNQLNGQKNISVTANVGLTTAQTGYDPSNPSNVGVGFIPILQALKEFSLPS